MISAMLLLQQLNKSKLNSDTSKSFISLNNIQGKNHDEYSNENEEDEIDHLEHSKLVHRRLTKQGIEEWCFMKNVLLFAFFLSLSFSLSYARLCSMSEENNRLMM